MTDDILKKPILKKPGGSGAKSVPELLSPAGDPMCAKAAVIAGADAIYLGLKEGSARAAAGNFTFEELRDVCRYAHMRGVKVYAAVNTLPFGEAEARRFASNAQKAASEGADGVIVQDVGLLALLLKMRKTGQLPPFFRIHASTQAGIANLEGLRLAEKLGIDRVILPRELDLAEIAALKAGTDVELEIFVHGAMCMCFSGSCLLSSYIGGRSGNRGNCAQPCRMRYAAGAQRKAETGSAYGYPLSPGDLCALPFIDSVCASGVSSVKIEGRLKSPEYTALTTRIYREALDSAAEGRFDDFRENELTDALRCLKIMFSRSGGGPGFLLGNTGKEHITGLGPGRTGAYVGEADNISPAPSPSGSPAGLEFFTFRLKKAGVNAVSSLKPGDGVTLYGAHGNSVAGGTVNRSGTADGAILVCGNIDRGTARGASSFPVYQTADAALDKAISALIGKESENVRLPAEFDFRAVPGSPAELRAAVPGTGLQVRVCSEEPVSRALSMPVGADNISRLLSKLSGTLFYASAVHTDIADNIFMPVFAINSLRRKAVSALTDALEDSVSARGAAFQEGNILPEPETFSVRSASRSAPEISPAEILSRFDRPLSSRFYFDARDYISDPTRAAAECALVYLPFGTWKDAALLSAALEKARKNGSLTVATLPLLPFRADKPGFRTDLEYVTKNADGLQLTNIGDLGLLEFIREASGGEKLICADHSLNTANPYTLNTLAGSGADIVTLSPEYPDVSLAGKAPEGVFTEIARGPFSLMRTRHCVIGHGEKNCRRCEEGSVLFKLTGTDGGKYDILTLPDADRSEPLRDRPENLRASEAVNYGRRYCENVILSTKEFTPFALAAQCARFPEAAEETARGGGYKRIITRTQIGPGKYRS